ncbi:MAG: endonuclease [Bacteroidetes bacterium]|nr:endonuclease [Bacteroidota bacterium]
MKPTFLLLACLLSGISVSFSQVTLSTKTIGFGSKPANVKDSLFVTVNNPTTTAVTIGSLSSSDSAFTLRAEASVIPANSSKKVWIRIKAPHNITYSERVFITIPTTLQSFILTVTASVYYSDNGSYYSTTQNLWDNQLRDTLQAITGRGYNAHSTSASSSYDQMREYMYATADDYDFQDTIECVYTGIKGPVTGRADAFIAPYNFNAEHTWPQSMFDDVNGNPVLPMYSDLHHLFPANATANQVRSNYPFGIVTGIPTWAVGGSQRGTLTTGGTGFEPRDVHKGNATRSLFYFITRYQNYSNFMTTAFEGTLRKWAKSDLVDANEKTRNGRVQTWQGNRNPFVDHPEFIDRIYDFVNRLVRPDQPKLAISSTNVVFGAKPSGTTSSFYLKFTNTGPKVTNLESASITGTGFTVGYKPATNKTIAKGIADSIEIRYTSSNSSLIPTGSITISLALATSSQVYTIQLNGSGNGDFNNSGGTVSGSTPTGSTSPVSGFVTSGISQSGATLSWSLPSDYDAGVNDVIVLVKQGSSPSVASGNSSSVVANSDFSLATSQLNSDGKLVYRGDGNSVTLSGLLPSTAYFADVYVVLSSISYSSVAEGTFTTSAPVSTDLISEGFASGSTAPSGWIFTGVGTYTTSGNFGALSPSLRFDNTGDQIISPVFSSPSQLSFWYKGQSTSGSSFKVEELNGSSGLWTEVVTISNFATTGTTVSFPMLITSTKLKFTYTKNLGNLSFDDVKVTGTTLPVELINFTGSFSDGLVTLNWKTASETNNYGWEIQKSALRQAQGPGTSTPLSDHTSTGSVSNEWEKLGFVAGKGTSTEIHSYSFSSLVPFPSSLAIFRLKQIDLDGTVSYSPEIELNETPDGILLAKAYPNPFNPDTKLEISLPRESTLKIELFNSLGQKVKLIENGEKKAGIYYFPVTGAGFTSGVYFVRITAGQQNISLKLVLLK